jgi:hypothetical protein
MRSKMMPFVVLAAVLMVFLVASSCGGGSSVCPTCGTNNNGTITLIDTMLVPEHNGNGEPGGPFNIFDIGWVDSVNHLYYVTDRVGLDVPVFSTVRDVAVFDIGGDNSIADSGNNVSPCFVDAATGTTIPPIVTAQGNYTRFGCKTLNFRLAGGFGPNGHFGGFVGGQCCASRSNNLNPLTGPNGLELFADGLTAVIGNGSSNGMIFDMTQTLADIKNNLPFPTAPTAIADLVSGTSPDYDGPNGIGPCQASANGRAFADPTCGDLRGDELATTGPTPAMDPAGNPHDLVLMINGDPGLPYVTLFDVTHVIHKTGTLEQQHCLPVVNQKPFSPGGPNNVSDGFPRNFATCVLGQIYYDNALPTDSTVAVDENNGFACPDPSLEFFIPPGGARVPVPSGASGTGVGSATHLAGVNVPCHHGPMLRNSPPPSATNGQFCPAANSFPDCFGAVALAGLGGMVYNPNTGHFLLTNGSATTDLTVGTVDEIDPRLGNPAGPVVINSFLVPGCMPSGVSMGPGTDALVTCAGHDGRQFAPTTYIINGTTGAILATINNVGGVDQGWYNPGDNRYYLGARDMPTGPVMGVIDAGTRLWLQNVPTQGNTHSVAADSGLNKIYLPLPAGALCRSQQIDGCVGVYAKD